jgi:SOS-response transcriptional repressor LexA
MKNGFRDTLWQKLRERGWTYEDLARRVGVTGVYVSQIMQGKKVPSDEVIVALARALDLDLARMILLAHYEKAPAGVKPIFERLSRHTPAEFMGDVGRYDNIELAALGHAQKLPVVGLVQAGSFMPSEDGEFPAGIADDYIYSDQRGQNLFGVRLTGDSMEPEFKAGDILVVNPNLEPQNGDFVIAKLKNENEATFKKLILHPPLIILRPLNSRYEDIVLNDPASVEIVGKVVERKTLL